jgi:hypothetical protein
MTPQFVFNHPQGKDELTQVEVSAACIDHTLETIPASGYEWWWCICTYVRM